MPIFPGAALGKQAYQIENSLIFNDDDSAYLNRTFSTPTDNRVWTWSGWVKRCNLPATQMNFFTAGASASARGIIGFNNTHTLRFGFNDGSWYIGETSAVFRDVSAHYHIVVACELSNGTVADRAKLYVNGIEHDISGPSWPNADKIFNSATAHQIGRTYSDSSTYLDSYVSEVRFIDGQARGLCRERGRSGPRRQRYGGD